MLLNASRRGKRERRSSTGSICFRRSLNIHTKQFNLVRNKRTKMIIKLITDGAMYGNQTEYCRFANLAFVTVVSL